jgi:hypothetical protein
MANVRTSIERANAAIEKATASREVAIESAFLILQERKPLIAQALLDGFRDGRKAARWMCLHQRAFNGKNAYQAIAEGDEDLVWDEMARSTIGNFGFAAVK